MLIIFGSSGEFQIRDDLQVSISAVDISASRLHGDTSPQQSVYVWPQLPAGAYYLLEGELRPIVEGAPPGAVPFSEESGLIRLQQRAE